MSYMHADASFVASAHLLHPNLTKTFGIYTTQNRSDMMVCHAFGYLRLEC